MKVKQNFRCGLRILFLNAELQNIHVQFLVVQNHIAKTTALPSHLPTDYGHALMMLFAPVTEQGRQIGEHVPSKKMQTHWTTSTSQ